MLKTRYAIHSVVLDGQPPVWVQLLPSGTFAGRDARGPYHLRDAQGVVAATLAYQAGADLPIDYDHQIYHAPKNGQPAIAAGWIKELQARGDGIWGRVEWTEAAAERLKQREYRYLSPAIIHDAAGTVLRIEGAGLVNNPNLELTALAAKLPGGNAPMTLEEFLKRLAKLHGLPQDVTAEAVVTHAQRLVDERGLVAKLAELLGLPNDSSMEQLVTHAKEIVVVTPADLSGLALSLGAPKTATIEQLAIHAKSLGTTNEPDPGKYVSLSVHNALAGELKSIQDERAKEKASQAVAKAKAEGKLIPAQEDWALALASKDLDGFLSWASVAPVVVSLNSTTPTGQPQSGADDPDKLATEITSYMSQQRKSGRDIGYAQALSELQKNKGGSR